MIVDVVTNSIKILEVSEGAAVNWSFASFNLILFWAIENPLELTVSLMWLDFSEYF